MEFLCGTPASYNILIFRMSLLFLIDRLSALNFFIIIISTKNYALLFF